MKIAMHTTVGDRCGIAAYTRALVDALKALPDTEVEVVPIMEGRQPKEHYLAVAGRLNATDVDVVHIQHEHSFWGGILPRHSAYWELRYLIKKPIVLTAHTTYTAEEMLRYRAERRLVQKAAKWLLLHHRAWVDSVQIAPFVTALTIVHTEEARKALIQRGADPRYLFVVPAGVPKVPKAPTCGESFLSQFGLKGKRPITIFGYTAPNKGYELTLRLLPQLPSEVVLVIAGGPRNESMVPYYRELLATIERENLGERVVITGYLTDEEVAEAMAASVLVLAPHTEATGSYSVTVPLAHGRAVLASDLACFREIVGRLECLELFRAGDFQDYAARLKALLADDARRTYLEKQALLYTQQYSWCAVAMQTRKIYEKALSIYEPVLRKEHRGNGKKPSEAS